MKFYVISDERAKVREAFVMPEPEPDEPDPLDGYSGWFTVASFDSVEEAKAFCDSYNEYEDDPSIYVVDDYWAEVREAFVASAKELAHACANYDGYEVIEIFDSAEEAKAFCDSYNEYEGESDVSFSCCSRGCMMCAYDAAHSTGYCAHEGE